ncbi:MAG: TadE/TadG family type IV pilus assembly protein, partial [Alphaproteobacteria bacterium]
MSQARSKVLRVRELPANEDGSVAIEFAFVAPFLLILILGVVEATNMLAQDRTVALANETMVDYVARLKTVSATDQTTVSQALDLMMSPYNSSYT